MGLRVDPHAKADKNVRAPVARANSQSSGVTPEYGRFFLGPNRAVVPKPSDEANRCNLRHVAPKALQKALYVGYLESGKPLQVVGLGQSQFPFPEARLAGQAGQIYG